MKEQKLEEKLELKLLDKMNKLDLYYYIENIRNHFDEDFDEDFEEDKEYGDMEVD